MFSLSGQRRIVEGFASCTAWPQRAESAPGGEPRSANDFVQAILDTPKMTGVQQAHKEDDLHRTLIRLVAKQIEDAVHLRAPQPK